MNRRWKFAAGAGVIACGLAILSRAQSPQSPPTQQGRFQVFQFDYNAFAGAVVKDTAVFRIDSQTGETWRYYAVVVDGKQVNRWIKIQEPQP